MKTESKHTPGPWRICDKGEASPHTSNICSADGHKVCTVESYPYLTTGKADAHLISAAPELLEACQMAAVRLEGGTQKEIEFNAPLAAILRSAILKAQGGEK